MGLYNVADGADPFGQGGANNGTAEPKPNQSKNRAMLPPLEPEELGRNELLRIIPETIAPTTWDGSGGQGSIYGYKNHDFIVNQTRTVHQQIERFMEMINRGGENAAQSMVVEAYWLLLDSSQLERLRSPGKPDGKQVRLSVNPKVLEELARSAPGLRGQIACFNNQTVHIVAGDRRNVILGSVPVVGGGVGYQPVTANVNIGALLQVCPAYISGMNSASVDIESTVTGWREGLEPVRLNSTTPPMDVPEDATPGAPSIKEPGNTNSLIVLDRVCMPAQQIACTLRVPLGKPVLVGGLTLDPTKFDSAEVKPADAKNAETKPIEKKQLYLIIRVSECEEE